MKKIFIVQIIMVFLAVAAWAGTPPSVIKNQDKAVTVGNANPSHEKEAFLADVMNNSEGYTGEETEEIGAISSQPGFLHRVIFYIPDRILDTFDIVRLRVRLGPGLAAGVRATEPASVFIGGYESVWVGLPGPRYERYC